MKKYNRMTDGQIKNIAQRTEIIGDGYAKCAWFLDTDVVKVKTPMGKAKINYKMAMTSDREKFLSHVNDFLKENKMYLSVQNYREQKHSGFIPHKIKGIFYKEKKIS